MRAYAGSAKDVRAGVVARLRARREELAEAIYARVSDRAFGVVGAADAEYMAGLREAVVVAVGHGLDGIERGEGWVGAIPIGVSEQARRAARTGVSLETVLRRYVVGHTLMGEFVLEEADRGQTPGERSVLREALRAQASVLERLLAAITVEYEDELARVCRSPERRRLEFVRELLAGERVGAGSGGAELGAMLGYELGGEHVGVIARGEGVREVLRGVAEGLDRRLLCVECDEVSVWAWLGGRRRMDMVALERALSGDMPAVVRSEGAQSAGGTFAVGEPAKGIAGWRLSHQQAQAALVVARRRPRRLTRYADVALLAMALQDELLGRALVEIYVASLEDARGGGPVLRETLRAYLGTERSVSSAAAALQVTRKTVESRLRAIEERLGRSLHPCPAELEVALELHEIGVGATRLEPDSSAAKALVFRQTIA
jgi:PucR C-terminal helix-turn-helix domain/GGDEF-like domain